MAISRRTTGWAAWATWLVLLCAVPSLAHGSAVPCDAFTRTSQGAWRVLGPVVLDLGGRLYSPTVGTTFPAGASQNGIAMGDVLDRSCGNR